MPKRKEWSQSWFAQNSKDTDVFVSLLYHQQETFPDIKELFVRKGGRRSTRKIVPLHLLSKELDPLLIECLPAIHAITGCDTTSKVAAKTSIFSKSTDLNLIKDFGKRMLTTAMLKKSRNIHPAAVRERGVCELQ